MIKIVSGTYGPKLITSKDPPFSLSRAEEERLVNRGVAEYTDSSAKPVRSEESSGATVRGGTGNAGSAFTLGSLKRVNKTALEKLAGKRGVDLSSATNNAKRAELIWDDIQSKKTGYIPETIEEVEALAVDDAADDGEALPELIADGPVI